MTPTWPPVPLERLIQHVIADGSSDYDDGLGGWSTGIYDAQSEVLTLRYVRDSEIPADTAEKWGFVYGPATYRFKLLPD